MCATNFAVDLRRCIQVFFNDFWHHLFTSPLYARLLHSASSFKAFLLTKMIKQNDSLPKAVPLISIQLLVGATPARAPRRLSGKEPVFQCRRYKGHGFDPWVRETPWRWKWQPIPVFLPGKSHGERSLVVCSPWSHKGSDMTEHTHMQYAAISNVQRTYHPL